MRQKSSKDGRRSAWMSKELLTKLGHKKEGYKRWKKGQVAHLVGRVTVQACRLGKPKST